MLLVVTKPLITILFLLQGAFLVLDWYMVPPWTLGMAHDVYSLFRRQLGDQGHNTHIYDF